jgi:hypothetical protein
MARCSKSANFPHHKFCAPPLDNYRSLARLGVDTFTAIGFEYACRKEKAKEPLDRTDGAVVAISEMEDVRALLRGVVFAADRGFGGPMVLKVPVVEIVAAPAVEALIRFSVMRGEMGGKRYCRDSGAVVDDGRVARARAAR